MGYKDAMATKFGYWDVCNYTELWQRLCEGMCLCVFGETDGRTNLETTASVCIMRRMVKNYLKGKQ